MKNYFYIALFLFVSKSFAQEKKTFSIYFESNKSILPNEELNKLQKFINENSKRNLIIHELNGFTDTVGNTAKNLILAKKRVDFVLNQLSKSSMTTQKSQSLGEDYKTSNFSFDQGDLRSWRRVDIVYSDSKKEFDLSEMVKKDTINKFANTAKFRENALSESGIVLDVQFYGGTADMFPNAMQDIVALAEFLKANKNLKTLVRGHVCCMDDYPLSVKRAEAVYNTLIQLGIETNRLDYKGFSNYMRVADPEVTEADKQRNRRVDVVFTKIN